MDRRNFLGDLTRYAALGAAGTSLTQRSRRQDVRWHNNHRGYNSCTVTATEWRADYRIVEYVSRPDAPRITAASWRCEHGRAGVVKA